MINGKSTSVAGGNISIDLNSINVIAGSKSYPACSQNFSPLDSCFKVSTTSRISNFGTLTIHGIQSSTPITITYNGQLTSSITRAECQNGTACNEKVINQSFVSDMSYCVPAPNPQKPPICTQVTKNAVCQNIQYINDKGQIVTYNPCNNNQPYTIISNTTIAELVCQYFLTRASGDIFLEDELKYGIDVSKCYPFKNISSTIAKPAKPIDFKAPKTGGGETIIINHEICSAGQSNFANITDKKQQDALKTLFGADISTLSSQICEVGLVPGENWDKASIDAAIAKNIGKLTRWKQSGIPTSNSINDVSQIKQSGGIYYYKGTGDTLTIDRNGLKIPEGSGALTIIVENADLQINGDIQYTSDGTPPSTTKEIASLGVIVINGNMYVAPEVKNLAGAYFIQRLPTISPAKPDYTKGNIISGNKTYPGTNSDNQLTINGSVYGNIGPLFEHRTAAGDIENDEGAITIRYDQRIIQNPPAGLRELLGTFTQSQIAR